MGLSSLGRLPLFSTIGHREQRNAIAALKSPLSGYIAGRNKGGRFVSELSEQLAAKFSIPDASLVVPCNSATTGLLAACVAAGVKRGDEVWCTPLSMSATAACAVFLGAKIRFIDIEERRYGADPDKAPDGEPRAIIVSNIFGHPCYLNKWRTIADEVGAVLIEDCAQSPFAHEDGQMCGTVGDMGVLSFNVHKHIQAGEGGAVLCRSEKFSTRVHNAVNHGQLDGIMEGLNFRMTEVTAAILCAQLRRADEIINGRIRLAEKISAMFSDIPWVEPYVPDDNCKHVWYLWTAKVHGENAAKFIGGLQQRNIPFHGGYAFPLNYRFMDSSNRFQDCPVSDRVSRSLMTFEICAYDPPDRLLGRMEKIIGSAAKEFGG